MNYILQPEQIIIPLSVLRDRPNVFEEACDLCGTDPDTTELLLML